VQNYFEYSIFAVFDVCVQTDKLFLQAFYFFAITRNIKHAIFLELLNWYMLKSKSYVWSSCDEQPLTKERNGSSECVDYSAILAHRKKKSSNNL
jgi:hypothetical protein